MILLFKENSTNYNSNAHNNPVFYKEFVIKYSLFYLFYFLLKFIFDLEIFENVGSGLYKLTWINIFFPFVYVLMLLKLLKIRQYTDIISLFFYSNFSFCKALLLFLSISKIFLINLTIIITFIHSVVITVRRFRIS